LRTILHMLSLRPRDGRRAAGVPGGSNLGQLSALPIETASWPAAPVRLGVASPTLHNPFPNGWRGKRGGARAKPAVSSGGVPPGRCGTRNDTLT
jgi:hypothetical protein